MGNRGGINPGASLKSRKVENHEMNKSETHLFKKGQQLLQSKSFANIVTKIAKKYDFVPIIPEMCKVILNKRLKKTLGFYYSSTIHIEINYNHYKTDKKRAYKTLKHEIVHLFVDYNFTLSMKNKPSYTSFERTCMYAFGFNGAHGAYPYMYTCQECGSKQKMSHKSDKIFCRTCGNTLITQKEYDKLVKVKEIGSKYATVNLNRYGLFKETQLIDI